MEKHGHQRRGLCVLEKPKLGKNYRGVSGGGGIPPCCGLEVAAHPGWFLLEGHHVFFKARFWFSTGYQKNSANFSLKLASSLVRENFVQ
ncbi:MAG: hypothetical protein HW380_547 [Magnetococcales bacterium]|nr:hypothetical protein [Magnetococcales bacterium]